MTLDELRTRIDALDGEIVTLLNERARCAQQIGELKKNVNAPIYVPEREQAVFKRLAEHNAGPPFGHGHRVHLPRGHQRDSRAREADQRGLSRAERHV